MASDLATLKQKIIVTDKLIREYQSSKFECDVLKKKNEELTKLTDKLHNELSARNRECTRLLAEADPLKKANAELKKQVEQAYKEAHNWESELKANKVYTNQLAEKVKTLEKFEREQESHAATTKELTKMKTKLETFKDQTTEAKESLAKARRDLKSLQTKHKQLVKYAVAFGNAAVNNGKLTIVQRRFYQRLCEGNDAPSEDECNMAANGSTNEDEIQSKMLEDLLTNDEVETVAETPRSAGRSPRHGQRKSPRSSQTPSLLLSPPKQAIATPQFNVTPQKRQRQRGRPKKVDTISQENITALGKEEPKVNAAVESSDTDATIESDQEVAIKGITRIRTRSTSKSIAGCTPNKKSQSSVLKREVMPVNNVLSEFSGELNENSLLEAASVASLKKIIEVEEDLDLSSSSDEHEEQEKVRSPAAAQTERNKQQNSEKVTHIPTRHELTSIEKSKAQSSEPHPVPEPEVQQRLSYAGFSPSSRSVKKHDEIPSVSSVFDNEGHLKSPTPKSNIASEFSLSSPENSPVKRVSTKIPEESVPQASSNVVLTNEKAADATNQGSTSSIFDVDIALNNTVSSTTTNHNEKPGSETTRNKSQSTAIDSVEAIFLKDAQQVQVHVTGSLSAVVTKETTDKDESTIEMARVSEESLASLRDQVTVDDNQQVGIVANSTGHDLSTGDISISQSAEAIPEENEVEPTAQGKVGETNIEVFSDTTLKSKEPNKPSLVREFDEESETSPRVNVAAVGGSSEDQKDSEPIQQISPPVQPEATSELSLIEEGKPSQSASFRKENSKSVSVELLAQKKLASIQPVPGEIQSELPSTLNESMDIEPSLHLPSVKDSSIINSDARQEKESSQVEPQHKPSASEAASPVRQMVEGRETHSALSETITSGTIVTEKLTNLEKEPKQADKLLSQSQPEIVFPVSQRKGAELDQSNIVNKKNSKPAAANVAQSSNSIQILAGKDASINAFEIDRGSLTATVSSTFTDAAPSAAVQVPEIHSSPSKLKPKKNKAQNNIIPEPIKSTEQLLISPTSTFIPIQNQAPAFKVPAVPRLLAHRDSMALLKRSYPALSEEQDREVNKILQEARTLFTDVPRVLSPLPEPPKPKPEPKHSMIPRCAFNWMGKKLPISTELTEQYGAYVKPGARIRVRFRRVSRRLSELRAPDIICSPYSGVANYAEAERRPVRLIDPNAPLIDEAESSAAIEQNSSRSTPPVQPIQMETLELHGDTSCSSLEVSKTREKSKDRSKKKQQSSATSQICYINNQEIPQLGLAIHTTRPAILAQEKLDDNFSTPSANVEKRPKLVLSMEEPATKISPQIQTPIERAKGSVAQTLSTSFEKQPNILPSNPQEIEARRRLQRQSELKSGNEKLLIFKDATEERAPAVEIATVPLERLPRTEHPLQPLSTTAPATRQRSKEVLFGSDSESGGEVEEPVPAQHRSLPKLISRPSLTLLATKARRPEHQPVKPPVTSHGLSFNSSAHTEPITTTPIRPTCIAPCSESLVAAVSKAKSTPRVVAVRRQVKDAATPVSSSANNHLSDESYIPLGNVSSKRRIAHAPKRPRENGESETPSKKAKTPVDEAAQTSLNAQPNLLSETRVQSAVPPLSYPTLRVRTDLNQSKSVQENTQQAKSLSANASLNIDESPSSPEDMVIDEGNGVTEEIPFAPISTVSESQIATVAILDSPESPPANLESPESPPTNLESPESPPANLESPESPPIELESPESPPAMQDTPQSPPKGDRNLPMASEARLKIIPQSNSYTGNIPAEASVTSQTLAELKNTMASYSNRIETAETAPRIDLEDLPAHLAVLLNDTTDQTPKISKALKKIRMTVRQAVDKVCQADKLTDEIFNKAVDRLSLGLVAKHPFVVIRHFVLTVIRACDADVDLTHTPPLPPLPITHQRIIALLLTLDEKNRELDFEPHRYSNYFLSETSYSMFNSDSVLTADEMCSLSRAYVALCRAIGNLGRARSFLYDCLFMQPPRAYALAYTAVTVWGEILRPVTFPIGPSCVDQTIAFLLLFCLKVKAAPGTTGRVASIRTLLQTTYGYKGSTVTTASVLLDSLVHRLKETQNVDEASSLAWCLALIARWEGVAWAINTIEKVLWPFLQRWSAGEGTNAGAVAAIRSIGLLGKWVPAAQRKGVDMVFGAMKTLIGSPDVAAPIVEAAVETVVLLGKESQPQSVLHILKEWKPEKEVSDHLRNVLKGFLRKNMNEKTLVNYASDENNSASE